VSFWLGTHPRWCDFYDLGYCGLLRMRNFSRGLLALPLTGCLAGLVPFVCGYVPDALRDRRATTRLAQELDARSSEAERSFAEGTHLHTDPDDLGHG
jgi:hypothetical protein